MFRRAKQVSIRGWCGVGVNFFGEVAFAREGEMFGMEMVCRL